MKKRYYSEATDNEILTFYNSLENEKERFNSKIDTVKNHRFLLAERINDEIVAIFFISPYFFLNRVHAVVKKEFQSKGIGKKIFRRAFEHAKRFYDIIYMTPNKENIGSIKLCMDNDRSKIIGDYKNNYVIVRSFNRKGDFISIVLKLFFKVINMFYSFIHKK